MPTEKHELPCGCFHSITRDDKGTILYTDEAICKQHSENLWDKLAKAPPNKHIPPTSEPKDRTETH